mmetsp:Transcript_9667/g.29291  ORF Transcript_9667/g.29291 Transcript_9667/m.29291 type:complete len:385 (+) Transcript_9667:998-2152(+)
MPLAVSLAEVTAPSGGSSFKAVPTPLLGVVCACIATSLVPSLGTGCGAASLMPCLGIGCCPASLATPLGDGCGRGAVSQVPSLGAGCGAVSLTPPLGVGGRGLGTASPAPSFRRSHGGALLPSPPDNFDGCPDDDVIWAGSAAAARTVAAAPTADVPPPLPPSDEAEGRDHGRGPSSPLSSSLLTKITERRCGAPPPPLRPAEPDLDGRAGALALRDGTEPSEASLERPPTGAGAAAEAAPAAPAAVPCAACRAPSAAPPASTGLSGEPDGCPKSIGASARPSCAPGAFAASGAHAGFVDANGAPLAGPANGTDLPVGCVPSWSSALPAPFCCGCRVESPLGVCFGASLGGGLVPFTEGCFPSSLTAPDSASHASGGLARAFIS